MKTEINRTITVTARSTLTAEEYAVINENSAVPLDLVLRKPPVRPGYSGKLKPPRGSADMTTDWFRQGRGVHRHQILQGAVKG